jgi:hypothetical protein
MVSHGKVNCILQIAYYFCSVRYHLPHLAINPIPFLKIKMTFPPSTNNAHWRRWYGCSPICIIIILGPFITHCFYILLFNINLYIVNFTFKMNLTYTFLLFSIHICSHVKGKGGFPQTQTWNKQKNEFCRIFFSCIPRVTCG